MVLPSSAVTVIIIGFITLIGSLFLILAVALSESVSYSISNLLTDLSITISYDNFSL